jgi:hypothetical protein
MVHAAALLCLSTLVAGVPGDEWAERRIDPARWGGTAWGEFRFGMGPADVSRVIERRGATEWQGAFVKREGHTALTVSDELVVQGSQVRLAGAFGTVVFAFHQGLLYQVRFTADSGSFEGVDTRDVWNGWTTQLVADATKSYGKPIVTEKTYMWRVGDLEVSTTRGLPQIWFTSRKVRDDVSRVERLLKGGGRDALQ